MSGQFDKEMLADSVTDQEQRSFLKICKLLEWNGPESHKLLDKALGPRTFSLSTVKKWFTEMNKGRCDLQDARGEAHNVTPDKDRRIEAIQECLAETRSWSIKALAQRVNVPESSVRTILMDDFGLTKKLGKLVPHELTEEQKETRIDLCRDNLLRHRRHGNLLKKTLAIDESWVSLYRPAHKNKSAQWLAKGEVGTTQPRGGLWERKRMLIMAMDIDGIAFWHLCEEKQTVTSQVYKKFFEDYVPKWMEGKRFKGPVILHDNARPHKTKLITEFLANNHYNVWSHPPYSPDCHPCDFNCFGPLKARISGICYNDWDSVKSAIDRAVREGSQSGLFRGVTMLPERWQTVIDKEGEYI